MIAFELVLKIIAGIVVGFILYKVKILDNHVNASLSRMLVEIVCPFMIFANIMSISGLDIAEKKDVYIVLLLGVVIYLLLVPVALLATKLLRTPESASGVFQCMLIFGNIGFIGLPVAESLYGASGVFFMALLNIHFNFLCYSYGLWLITKDAQTKYKFSPKRLINPALISILIAMILFLLDVRFPEVAIAPFSFIGNITSPLSMLVVGSSIAAHDLKEVFSEWRLYALSAIRMVIFPVITFLIMRPIFGPGAITNIVTLHMGTPAAVVTSMFAMAYGGEEKTATSGVAMTNIFFIITIPFIYWLTSSF